MNIKQILQFVERNENSAFFYTPNYYGGKSYFFPNVSSVLSSTSPEDIQRLFFEVDERRENGEFGFALLPYELGYLFEDRLKEFATANIEPVRFFFSNKKDVSEINCEDLDFSGMEDLITATTPVENFKLNISKEEFIDSINKIKNYIREGDTYQVNYTVKVKFNFNSSIAGLFALLIYNQSAKYSCIINLGDKFILSISPELFFEVDRDKIIVKPMKGTIPRGKNIREDVRNKNTLELSKKDSAENIMIVDLLRNDLGRISEFNSVKPESIFEIEKYESVFQMVSTVSAKLKKNSFAEIIRNLFPCGSITGAPKIRTMRIIHELEKCERGVYTGAIGLIGKDFLKFNVPIRTLEIDKNGDGQVGLGSGVVWDSNAEAEYEETLTKGKFIYNPTPYFELIETMKFEGGEIFLLDKHLRRLRLAADFFLFKYDERIILSEIKNLIRKLSSDTNYKIRLTLNKWGAINITFEKLGQYSEEVKVIISKERIDSSDKFIYFKTTNRNLYDSQYSVYSKLGYADVLFLNENDELTEGAITNLFLKIDGQWFTPDLDSGLLNGTYREYFMENNNCKERKLFKSDLFSAQEIVITNSVRGEMKVTAVDLAE